MLWVKTLHIVFIISWFAGLFYLPRLYVNLAEVADSNTQHRLLEMAQRLYRFTTLISIPALAFGIWLYVGYGMGMEPGNGWLHAKLLFVALTIGYHHACGVMLRKFEMGNAKRSATFYRWFNEIPVVLLLIIVALVIIKPF